MSSSTSTDNGYVVVWSSYDQDGSAGGIFGQIYTSDNTPYGEELIINSFVRSSQHEPSVTGLTDGGFVVTWQSYDSWNGDHSGYGISGQIFDAEGDKVGTEFLVNSATVTDQTNPSVAALNDGGFVITWHGSDSSIGDDSFDISGQLFAADGSKVGDEFLVNTSIYNSQSHSSVTSLSDGGFVVTWHGNGHAIGGEYSYDISGQLFDNNGNKIGDEFLANTYTTYSQYHPSVASLSDGGFVVSWQSYGDLYNSNDIAAQRFDANGNKVGNEILVNSFTSNNQYNSAATGLSDGGFVVTWHGYAYENGDDSLFGISGQRFDQQGQKVGEEFLINTHTENSQLQASVAAMPDGGYVVTWYGYDSTIGDASYSGISGQRFNADGNKTGSEFLINSYTTSYQWGPSVSTLGYNPVIDAKQAPEANDVVLEAREDSTSVSASFDATDLQGDDLTYTITSELPNGQGSVTNNNDGTFTFVPGDDFKGLDNGESQDVTFTYIATDDEGN